MSTSSPGSSSAWKQDIESVNPAVGDEHLVGRSHREPVLRAQLSRRADRGAAAARWSAGSASGCRRSRCAIAVLHRLSGASKLTSPWSSLNGRSTAYIMSRIRMIPEKGTESRKWDMWPNRDAAPTRSRIADSVSCVAGEREVADVEVPRAKRDHRADRPRADLVGRHCVAELAREPLDRHRDEILEEPERARRGAAVEEDPEDARDADAAPVGLVQKARHRRRVVVRHDLGQEELAGEVRVEQVVHLARRIAIGIGPAAEGQIRRVGPELAPQLPRVFDRPRDAHAARRRRGRRATRIRAGGRGRRTTGSSRAGACSSETAPRDRAARHRRDSTTRWRRLSSSSARPPRCRSGRRTCRARSGADGVVGVDPGIHAVARRELSARRAQFGRDDQPTRTERVEEEAHQWRFPLGVYNTDDVTP